MEEEKKCKREECKREVERSYKGEDYCEIHHPIKKWPLDYNDRC